MARKSSSRLTAEERLWERYYFETLNAAEAYRRVHDNKVVTVDQAGDGGYRLKERVFKKRGGFANMLEVAGVSDALIAKKLKELMCAEKVLYFQRDGEVTDERTVIDNTTRHAALRLAVELKGKLVEQKRLELSGNLRCFTDILSEALDDTDKPESE